MSATEPDAVAQAILAAHASGEALATQGADSRLWVVAIDDLIEGGELAAAAWAAPRLAAAFPEAAYFVSLARAFARLPGPSGDVGFDAFRDDTRAEVQVVRRESATTALVGFCGLAHRIGLPLNLMHRWLGQLGCHVIYLRDRGNHAFSRGVAALGADRAQTVTALRATLGELGTERVTCLGVSAGGYGALAYGLELGARKVLSLSGPTNGDPAFLARLGDTAYGRMAARESVVDLAPLYRDAPDRLRAHLVYGERMPFDRGQAENLSGLPRVSLEAVAEVAEHNVVKDLLHTGRLDQLLAWLVSAEDAPPL